MQNIIRWSVRIIITAILLFSILFEAAETISEKGFNEIIESSNDSTYRNIYSCTDNLLGFKNEKVKQILRGVDVIGERATFRGNYFTNFLRC